MTTLAVLLVTKSVLYTRGIQDIWMNPKFEQKLAIATKNLIFNL